MHKKFLVITALMRTGEHLDLATKAHNLEKDAQRLASTASALVAGLDSLKLDEQSQIYPDLLVGDA